jgi:glycine/D-amino acid oxidase-like deaminating enzyme
MKITVVGGGIMGLSAAWALARDGHAVSVFEQGPLPNPLGSSVDEHRLIRHPYGAARGYTRMIDPAYRAWDTLWADLGARLYLPTGTLVLDRGDRWTAETIATLEAERIPFRRLAASEAHEAYPLLISQDARGALLLDSGGTLLAGQIVAALARHLPTRGVRLHASTRVSRIDPDHGRVWIVEDGAERMVDADLVVVAAGPWVLRLLPEFQPRVTPSRQVVMYVEPPPALTDAWLAHPMVLDLDATSGFYLVPPRRLPDGTRTGLKIGDHRFTLSGEPDVDRTATADEIQRLRAVCARAIRDAGTYATREAKTCFYDVEPRERFIVERRGACGWVLSGFSGHGFKFGALLGLELARAIRGGRSAADLAAWAAGTG